MKLCFLLLMYNVCRKWKIMRQTTIIKHKKTNKKWYLINAENQILGKIAVFIADLLRGKNKSTFTPNVNTGDNIVVINASKVILTANKEQQKMYHHHSGYPGGLTSVNATTLRKTKPTELLRKAVYGMLPKTKLGKQQLLCLHLYSGQNHKNIAQKPLELKVK